MSINREHNIMKSRILLIICTAVVLSQSIFAQEVTRVKRPYVLIDIGQEEGVKVGDEMNLYRLDAAGNPIRTARIEIITFRGTRCGAKIIVENDQYMIRNGDRLLMPYETEIRSKMVQRSRTNPQAMSSYQYRPSRSHWLSYVSITAGLISGGLGYYFYNEADELSNIEPMSLEHQSELAEDIRKYDNQSNFSAGLGGGLVAFGVLHYFLTRNKPANPNQVFTWHPVQQKGMVGMGVQFALKKP